MHLLTKRASKVFTVDFCQSLESQDLTYQMGMQSGLVQTTRKTSHSLSLILIISSPHLPACFFYYSTIFSQKKSLDVLKQSRLT